MVLQQHGLFVAQRAGDVLAFLLNQHHAAEGVVHGQVVVERARVLRDDVDRASERAESTTVDGVGVRGAHDVWPGRVHGRVDHVGGHVEQAAGPAVDHLTVMVHQDQIRGLDLAKGHAERVHPEVVRLDGVAERDVAGDAFVVALLAEDAEGQCQPALEVGALFVLVGELGRAGELEHRRLDAVLR